MIRSGTPGAVSSLVILCLALCLVPRGLPGADCNRNGADDREDIAAGAAADCDGNDVPDECEFTPLQFGLRDEGMKLEGFPNVTAVADFDGDGLPDLAAGHADSTLSVILGSGEGSFAPAMRFDVRDEPQSLAAADLDGDGDVDVVMATHRVVRLLRNRGDGTFGPSTAVSTPSGASFAGAGDLTGDGIPDLVTTHPGSDAIGVLENLGGGLFDRATTFPVGAYPNSVALADLDGDGDHDVVVTERDSGSISTLLNDGEGALAPARSFGTGADRSFRVVAADLDGDGAADLAVSTSSAASILMSHGDGSFAAPALYAGASLAVAAGDLDRDGDIDLALGSRDSGAIRLLVNLGGGTFASREARAVFPSARTIDIEDMDRDGNLDLVASDWTLERIQVLWNGELGPAPHPLAPATVFAGATPHALAVVDADGDGDLDVITSNGAIETVAVFRNTGGELAAPTVYDLGGYLFTMAAGDLDGDGDADVVTADLSGGRVLVLLNAGDGTLGAPASYRTGAGPVMVTAADLDADGRLDVITANQDAGTVSLLFNAGGGALEEPRDLRAGSRPVAATAADLDGDGRLDLAVASATSRDVSILLADGDRTFRPAVAIPVPGGPLFVAAADLDRDGDPDLAAASQESAIIAVLLNEGDGSFSPPASYPVEAGPYSLISADVNADGFLDLITANPTANSVSLLPGMGDGTFRPPFFEYRAGTGPRFVDTGDLDLDGDLDLVVADHTSWGLTVFRNEPAAAGFEEAFLETVCTGLAFQRISVPSRAGAAAERAAKYILPAREDPELLPALFQNVERFPLHQEFLEAVFPDRFPALTVDEYNRLVALRATRDYYAGVITRLARRDGPAYGFNVVVDGSDPRELLTLEEVRGVYATLRRSFRLEPLGYFPDTAPAREAAAAWPDPGFPLYLEGASRDDRYQAYTPAVGYGRVRLLTEAELEAASARGEISFQSILVLERAPRDIEGVAGGIITQEPQGELSHLALRTARRGTPNAFVAGALEAFEPLDGRLIRLEVGETDYVAREAAIEEAAAFWSSRRPSLPELPRLDREFSGLSSLEEIAAMDLAVPQEPRFGGKATNLARLARVLAGSPFARYGEVGFGIPARYYLEFMDSNRIPSAIAPERRVTYAEHIAELFADPSFQSDSAVRFAALESFREYARERATVSPDLVARLVDRARDVFASTRTQLRFRSSSNVEDLLEFNGAGLYESTGACADDVLDGDDDGPSLCDPRKGGERDFRRALVRVWTSLWTFRAVEEREFFGIPQDVAAMGVLVSRSFLEEGANGVAFTGSLTNPLDRRYVITVQLGEEPVVSPAPGVRAEKDILEIVDGRVSRIIRPREGSSLVPPGEWILSDEKLEELGALMAHIDARLPIDTGGHPREGILLDMEFKLERVTGELAVKQVRPFLLPVPVPPTPAFELEIPAGTMVCGGFAPAGANRGPAEELELKSTVRFRAGTVSLETAAETFARDIVEEVLLGPDRERAVPLASGSFRISRLPGAGETRTYRFTYHQEFALAGGRSFELSLAAPLELRARGEDPIELTRILSDTFFIATPGNERLIGAIDGRPAVRYGPCSHDHLPRWQIDAELEDGTMARLEERWQPSENAIDTGPARLAWADVILGGERRLVSDYWQLVYSAYRHNLRVRYWIVLDPPIDVRGLEAPVRILELAAPEPLDGTEARASYLSENLEVLSRPAVISYARRPATGPPLVFLRRGDVNADGRVDMTDAVYLLTSLFVGPTVLPCATSADVDDSGSVNLVDAVYLVNHLFQGGPEPRPPYRECGADPTPDALSCEVAPPCGGRSRGG